MAERGGGALNYYEAYWARTRAGWSPRRVGTADVERALIAEHVRPGMRVLDVGCGDGRLGRLCGEAGARYLGLDVSVAAVRACRARGIAARVHDLSRPLPVPARSVDLVLSFEVLEHLFAPAFVCAQAARVLRRGGSFAGSVPNAASLGHRLLWLAGRPNPGGSPLTSLRRPWEDPHIRFFSPRTLAGMLAGPGGFAQVLVRGHPFSPLDLPVLYRVPDGPARAALAFAGRPFAWLGAVWPSLFASKLIFFARR
jgi:SAM-dependent methyltransferase